MILSITLYFVFHTSSTIVSLVVKGKHMKISHIPKDKLKSMSAIDVPQALLAASSQGEVEILRDLLVRNPSMVSFVVIWHMVCVILRPRMHIHTVQPVYSNHSRDQVTVPLIDRWSLYRGVLVSPRWPRRPA